MPASLPRPAAVALLVLVAAVVVALALRSFGVPLPFGPWAGASPILAGSPSPDSSADEPDSDAAFARIAAEAAAIRQLAPTPLRAPERLSRAELVERVAGSIGGDWPPAGMPSDAALLAALGLPGAGGSLPGDAATVLAGGMLARYDPDAERVAVATDATSLDALRVAFVHELTHALAEAAFASGSPEPGPDALDARLAWLALREGDARTTMLLWGLDHLGPEQLLGASAVQVPEAFAAPDWLVEVMSMPHLAGASFVGQLYAAGGWDAVNAAYADPPASTEQVLHYAKYLAGEAPLTVEVPISLRGWGPDWRQQETATMGEAWLLAWLGALGVDDRTAGIAAAGWGGDRIQLLAGPDGDWALGWRIAWDAPLDATEFADAYADAAERLGIASRLVPLDERESLLLTASSDAVLGTLLAATSMLGR